MAQDGVADPAECPWLRHEGFFQEVVGFHEAHELLADDRLHVDMVGLFEGVGITSGPVWETARDSLLSLNGPEHRRVRGLVAQHFTPRAVERVRPVARRAAATLVTELGASESSEFVSTFATPFVAAGTCALVGFPADGIDRCTTALEQVGFGMRDLGAHHDECAAGVEALVAYAVEVLALRRREPTGDVISELAKQVDQGHLTESVAGSLVGTLMSAGHEPTVNQLGLMMLVLSEHPDVWDGIGAGEIPVTRAVEELLRIRPTNRGTLRRVAEPIDYRGAHFTEGHLVLINLAEVSRDPSRFADPDRFDPRREDGGNLAFGVGAHYCLGAALARLQLQEALAALTAARTCPTVDEVVLYEGNGLAGADRLVLSTSSR